MLRRGAGDSTQVVSKCGRGLGSEQAHVHEGILESRIVQIWRSRVSSFADTFTDELAERAPIIRRPLRIGVSENRFVYHMTI